MSTRKWKKTGIRAAALLLGGTLLLPGLAAHAAAPYTAKAGDTFWLLSKRYGVPLQELMDANPNVNPLNVYAGLELKIPSTAAVAVSAQSTVPAVTITESKAPAQPANAVTTATGESLAFSKVLDVKATAYTDSPEENGWGPVDYFGKPLKLGTIAVDPKVIPFGTKVYITGYNFGGLPEGGLIATASDTGSAIKGNRIDIFVPGTRSYVSTFGVQNVKVYILK